MTLLIILLLTAAAFIGLFLVVWGLRYRKNSLKLGLLHASLAITGIVFLFTQIIQGPTNKQNNIAAFLLVLAVIGGGMILALREKNKPPAMAVVTIHAIAALVALSVLTYKYFAT